MANWAACLRQALRLGLTPDLFWRLSLREWMWLTAPIPDEPGLNRHALQALLDRFPDGGAADDQK